MIYPIKLRINGGRLTQETLVSSRRLTLSWGLGGEGAQGAYRLCLLQKEAPLYESGWISSAEQEAEITAPFMQSGAEYTVALSLRDTEGREGGTLRGSFRATLLEEWDAPWICPQEDFGDGVIYFSRSFEADAEAVENATLYLCGIGYHEATLNGAPVSDHRMAPAFSNYNKRCYYETLEVTALLKQGENCLQVKVAQGWRRNLGDYLKHTKEYNASFFGKPQLTAILAVRFRNGTVQKIVTDEAWHCGRGPIVCAHLFNGETYDARITALPQEACVLAEPPAPDTVLCPDLLEPIRVKKVWDPVAVYQAGGGYIFDLGQNIAGVSALTIPEGLPVGTAITLQHGEMLDEAGDLYNAPLRGALATDTYIVGEQNPVVWSPSFTYHGFRYVKVCGLSYRSQKSLLRGLQFYTDIDAKSRFRCGSPLVNQLQEMIVMTERDNIHSIATDCPQRDERMGWLNDASVRFEEMPYNFEVGRLFPKIIGDIRDEQVEGAIPCTAPYVFGNRPADPVSSSFLIAAYMCYLHYGNTEIIRDAYPSMCAWNDYLESISENGILPLSYYGDWASPKDCCVGSARSAHTPGEFMSTGYHYLNATLLAKFASILGNEQEAKRHGQRAAYVREAMLAQWVGEDGKVFTGSQGCQAFALRLGILPEHLRQKAADRMNQAVLEAGMRLTTGNLCTLYLMEMLAEYGYIDTAWALLQREEYPSWGYMMQNGATTVWERFERKKDPGMNSHCHPMYGAVGKWFYTHIAGIIPVEAGFGKIKIQPCFPKTLLSAEATVDTCKGDVTVKWERAYGKLCLLADIPSGTEATVVFDGKEHRVSGGTHVFYADETQNGPR